MIAWIFPIAAIGGVFVAHVLKRRLSNNNLNHARLLFALAFNALFVIPYINIIENKEFPFLGYRPDLLLKYPFIGWISFSCIFLHSFACPMKPRVKGLS